MKSKYRAENLPTVYDRKPLADFDSSLREPANPERSTNAALRERLAMLALLTGSFFLQGPKDLEERGFDHNDHPGTTINYEQKPIEDQAYFISDNDPIVSSEAPAAADFVDLNRFKNTEESLADTIEAHIDTEVTFDRGDEGVRWLMDQYIKNGVDITPREAYEMWLIVSPFLFNEDDAMDYAQPGEYADDPSVLEARPKANQDTEHEFYTVTPEAEQVIEDDIERRLNGGS